AQRGRTMRESPTLPMQDLAAAPDPHDRGVPDYAIALPASFDRCHDVPRGDMTSCLPYVSPANAKLPGMPTNPAETPDSAKAEKIGLSDDFAREKIDRRISVAPMMDWAGCRRALFGIKLL